MNDSVRQVSVETTEVELLIIAINKLYGYDFSNYSFTHVKRRSRLFIEKHEIESISYLLHIILRNPDMFQQLLYFFSINVTELFRDASFFCAFRKDVVPILHTYPFVKIWHAGCSTGEEVYSMAILLHEEGLLDKTLLYASDFNQTALERAKNGIYDMDLVKAYTKNYQKAGGTSDFSDYYDAKYDSIKFKSFLQKNMVFSDHNLVTDSSFGEMNVIVCRNVMIYFNKTLQSKVINLFNDSLVPGGILCIGSKETLSYNDGDGLFEPINKRQRIYKRDM